MRAKGNGRPEVCATNLLKITRGEVSYDRIRGRDGALVGDLRVDFRHPVKPDFLFVIGRKFLRRDLDYVVCTARYAACHSADH